MADELFGKATCIIVLFEERCRIRFVFGEDAIRVRKAAAAILLLGKLLADFHEEAVQSLFGLAQSFGKLVAEFVKFRLFCRDTACNFCNEAIAVLKETSIVGMVAVVDLTRAGDLVRSRTMSPYFTLVSVAIVYFILVFGLSKAVKRLERRLAQSDRH